MRRRNDRLLMNKDDVRRLHSFFAGGGHRQFSRESTTSRLDELSAPERFDRFRPGREKGRDIKILKVEQGMAPLAFGCRCENGDAAKNPGGCSGVAPANARAVNTVSRPSGQSRRRKSCN